MRFSNDADRGWTISALGRDDPDGPSTFSSSWDSRNGWKYALHPSGRSRISANTRAPSNGLSASRAMNVSPGDFLPLPNQPGHDVLVRHRARNGAQVNGMQQGSRLQLNSFRLASAHIDGAWWPRSPQLADELPGLVASVSDRLGQVVMVGYHRKGWDETPPLVEIAGRTIELLSFTSDEPASLIIIGEDGRHITLQVIPPEADEQAAQRVFCESQRRTNLGVPATGPSAVARSVADVAAKLAQHEGRGDEQRTTEIRRWCDEAAQQFVDAPLQTFVPILVEHIVRNRIIESRRAAI